MPVADSFFLTIRMDLSSPIFELAFGSAAVRVVVFDELFNFPDYLHGECPPPQITTPSSPPSPSSHSSTYLALLALLTLLPLPPRSCLGAGELRAFWEFLARQKVPRLAVEVLGASTNKIADKPERDVHPQSAAVRLVRRSAAKAASKSLISKEGGTGVVS